MIKWSYKMFSGLCEYKLLLQLFVCDLFLLYMFLHVCHVFILLKNKSFLSSYLNPPVYHVTLWYSSNNGH